MRLVLKLVLPLVLWCGTAAAVPVRLSIQAVGEAGEPFEARLRWSSEGTAPEAEALGGGERAVAVPGETVLDLPAGTVWNVRAEADGSWSEPATVISGRTETAVLHLLRTGVLRLKPELPEGTAQPAEVSVRFEPSPGKAPGGALPAGTVSCPLLEGRLACALPAGLLDLRLKAGAFVPVYLWGLELAAGGTRDVGDIRFQPGASVAGWVETDEGTVPSDACRVELSLYQPEEAADVAAQQRLRTLAAEARINGRGFFQVDGVEPGLYTLTATHPGFAPVGIAPVEVRAGLETSLIDRLVLARPLMLEVALDPPVDPYGQAWQVSLAPLREAAAAFRGTASSEGRWAQAGLAPGLYLFKVMGDLGSQWVSREVDLARGQPLLEVRIPVVEVRGRLRLGGEPLAGTLWFGGRTGPRRVRFDADEDGVFSGFLPEEGKWRVHLSSEGGQRVLLDPVEVERLSGKRFAEVEIVVPDTTLAGEVVDEEGRPVPAAQLVAQTLEKVRKGDDNRFEAGTDGKFRVRGLVPGLTAVQAEAGPKTSDWSQVRLEEARESPWVRLVVRGKQEIRGRVVSAAGPVPGAQLTGFPEMGTTPVSSGVAATADPAGEFRLALPAEARALHLVVSAPGFALRLARLPVSPEGSLEIVLEPQGGRLMLELPAAGGSPAPVLVHGGTFFPALFLSSWSQGPPGRLVLPNAGSGDYSLCAGTGLLAALREGKQPPASRCSTGFLIPNGELALKLPTL